MREEEKGGTSKIIFRISNCVKEEAPHHGSVAPARSASVVAGVRQGGKEGTDKRVLCCQFGQATEQQL